MIDLELEHINYFEGTDYNVSFSDKERIIRVENKEGKFTNITEEEVFIHLAVFSYKNPKNYTIDDFNEAIIEIAKKPNRIFFK